LSPVVQVRQQPSLVISHLQLHMAKLHWHISMPFIMQQQLHMPSAIMRQRFCTMAHAISSSQMQWIFMPPAHFSIFSVQRGTMHILPPAGMAEGIPAPGIAAPLGIPIEAIDPSMAPRSIIMTLDIFCPP
jgi:hypothetical protein